MSLEICWQLEIHFDDVVTDNGRSCRLHAYQVHMYINFSCSPHSDLGDQAYQFNTRVCINALPNLVCPGISIFLLWRRETPGENPRQEPLVLDKSGGCAEARVYFSLFQRLPPHLPILPCRMSDGLKNSKISGCAACWNTRCWLAAANPLFYADDGYGVVCWQYKWL